MSLEGTLMHMLAVSVISYHSPQHLLFAVALMMVTLTHVRLDLIVALICISPVNIDVKNLFMCCFGHSYVFFEEMSIWPSAHFLLLFFNTEPHELFCKFWRQISCWSHLFSNIFFHSVGFLSVLFTVSFCCGEALCLN